MIPEVIGADRVAAVLDYPSVVDAIETAFKSDITFPLRHRHSVSIETGSDSTLLFMPF